MNAIKNRLQHFLALTGMVVLAAIFSGNGIHTLLVHEGEAHKNIVHGNQKSIQEVHHHCPACQFNIPTGFRQDLSHQGLIRLAFYRHVETLYKTNPLKSAYLDLNPRGPPAI